MCDKFVNLTNNNNNDGCKEESSGSVFISAPSSSDTHITLIVDELNSIYQDRLMDIESLKQSGDSNELKSLTYKEWNEMLMDMIKNMIDAFTDLETEATRRISLLEQKFNQNKNLKFDTSIKDSTAQTNISQNHSNEIQDLQMTILHLKSDIDSLLEIIRRAVDDNNWSTRGLKFYSLKKEDVFNRTGMADEAIWTDKYEKMKILNSKLLSALQEVKKLDSEKHVLKNDNCRKDVQISQLEAKIIKLENEVISCSCTHTRKTTDSPDNSVKIQDENSKKLIGELRSCLVDKELQLANRFKENDALLNEIKCLQSYIGDKEKVIINMRSLAIEVADKHDQVQETKSQLLAMEDELQQAHKKIQFKDNVIKDLRKDCKNNSKYISSRENPTYHPGYISVNNCIVSNLTESRTIINFEGTDKQQNNLMMDNREHIGDMNLNMQIEFEKSKQRSCSAEEDCYMKVLGIELEDLLETQKDFNSEQYKQFNLIHKNIKEKCAKMIHDLVKSNAKLNYVRIQLMKIADVEGPKACDSDPGYISLEEKEPEESMISTVCDKISNLQNENKCLRNEISKLQIDIQSAKSNVSQKIAIIEKNGKLLKDVASCLSGICGKSISLENFLLEDFSVIQPDINRNRTTMVNDKFPISKLDNPLCAAIMDLEKEIIQRNNRIDEMKKITAAMEQELNCSNSKISILESETSYKEKTITELEEKNSYQKQSIQKLENEKLNCIEKLRQYTEIDLQTNYNELLEVNKKLQTESKNQLTTIQNLMEALETYKRRGAGDAYGPLNSQLAFDVLLEQLADHFDENYKIEKMMLKIRDENLVIKESLIDSQTDYRHLENFYCNIVAKEKQLQCQIASLESLNSKQDTKYKELYQKYQTLLDTLQRFKSRCKCGEARYIEFDENDTNLLDGRKGKELPHIFDLLERKTEELKRINELASNERTRLTKKIFDLEEDRNKLQIKIAVLDNSLTKKENELHQYQKENDMNSKSIIEKLTRDLNLHKNRELKLESDLKTIQKCMDVEKSSIIKSNDTVVHLEKQVAIYKEKCDAVNKENFTYKTELYAMKGKLATFEGTDRSLKEQLTKTQEELYNIRCNFQKTNSFNEEFDKLKKECATLKESNYKLIRQYNDLIEDYNGIVEEYRKLKDIKADMSKELEIHQKWQEEATSHENLVEQKFMKMEEHISCLMEDREALINKLNELHRDSILLSSELERNKECYADTLSQIPLQVRSFEPRRSYPMLEQYGQSDNDDSPNNF